MAVLDLAQVGETGLVLHFGTEEHAISASTFANSLQEFERLARAAAFVAAPNYEFEIYLEAIAPGTFRAWLKEVSVENLLSQGRKSTTAIALSLIATFVYDRYFDGENITETDDFVVIEHGDDKVVIPRDVYEVYNENAESQDLEEPVQKFVAAIHADEGVGYFALSTDIDTQPPFPIPREAFARLARPPARVLEQEEDVRNRLVEREVVGVLKAVFERGNRKWQFIWNGQKVSAPIVDDTFFDRLESREISFAQGDALIVDILVKEERMPGLSIWRQVDHKIIKVHGPIQAATPRRLF